MLLASCLRVRLTILSLLPQVPWSRGDMGYSHPHPHLCKPPSVLTSPILPDSLPRSPPVVAWKSSAEEKGSTCHSHQQLWGLIPSFTKGHWGE